MEKKYGNLSRGVKTKQKYGHFKIIKFKSFLDSLNDKMERTKNSLGKINWKKINRNYSIWRMVKKKFQFQGPWLLIRRSNKNILWSSRRRRPRECVSGKHLKKQYGRTFLNVAKAFIYRTRSSSTVKRDKNNTNHNDLCWS